MARPSSLFRSVYAYDRTPLNAVVERIDTVAPGAVRERVVIDAAYGGERMAVYVYRPLAAPEAPRQATVFFPGAGAVRGATFPDGLGIRTRALLSSGRMFVWPIIRGSYERRGTLDYEVQDETASYREHVISWYRDVSRTLDYLETRPDVDAGALGYLGVSMGSRMGAIMLALEPRFRAGVLEIAGLSPKPTQPIVDPFNFLPRITQPVIVLSGQFDPVFPLDVAARPFFETLGSEIKEHRIYPGAHFVPWPDLARETMAWYDRHLGPTGDVATSR